MSFSTQRAISQENLGLRAGQGRFGRTGQVFAMDRLEVVPDLVCLSKGLTGGSLPLAVALAREEIYQAFLDEGKERMFFHGHSFIS